MSEKILTNTHTVSASLAATCGQAGLSATPVRSGATMRTTWSRAAALGLAPRALRDMEAQGLELRPRDGR